MLIANFNQKKMYMPHLRFWFVFVSFNLHLKITWKNRLISFYNEHYIFNEKH